MLLYELFKVLDMDYSKCTVVVNSDAGSKTILEDGYLSEVSNKALYYIVDRIRVYDRCTPQKPLVKIDVIER